MKFIFIDVREQFYRKYIDQNSFLQKLFFPATDTDSVATHVYI